MSSTDTKERKLLIGHGLDTEDTPEQDLDELNKIFEFVENNTEHCFGQKLIFLNKVIDFSNISSACIVCSPDSGWGNFTFRVDFTRSLNDKQITGSIQLLHVTLSCDETRKFLETYEGGLYTNSKIMKIINKKIY